MLVQKVTNNRYNIMYNIYTKQKNEEKKGRGRCTLNDLEFKSGGKRVGWK